MPSRAVTDAWLGPAPPLPLPITAGAPGPVPGLQRRWTRFSSRSASRRLPRLHSRNQSAREALTQPRPGPAPRPSAPGGGWGEDPDPEPPLPPSAGKAAAPHRPDAPLGAPLTAGLRSLGPPCQDPAGPSDASQMHSQGSASRTRLGPRAARPSPATFALAQNPAAQVLQQDVRRLLVGGGHPRRTLPTGSSPRSRRPEPASLEAGAPRRPRRAPQPAPASCPTGSRCPPKPKAPREPPATKAPF